MNIVIMGPQGSGKSTQAKHLAEKLGLLYASTGEIIRESCKNGDSEIIAACEASKKGELFPDKLITQMLKAWISQQGKIKGIVLEGYPRTIEQIPELDKIGLPGSRQIDQVIYINTSEQECLERLIERAEIEQREDETPEAIKTRLNLYFTRTTPVLDFLRQKGILTEVNGNCSIEEIQQEIIEKLTISK